MKKLSFVFCLALVAGVWSAPAQGTVTRTVKVSGTYENITLAGTQNIHFAIGPADEPITVIGSPEDLDNLVVENRGGTLTVNFKKGYRSKSRYGVDVYAKNPNLKKATVSGTGTINISGELDKGINEFSVSGTGKINVEKIVSDKVTCSVSGTGKINCLSVAGRQATARVSGTGSIRLDMHGMDEVTAVSSGTGKVTLSGDARKADLKSSGTGNVQAEALLTDTVTAVTSGTGSVYCYARDNFDGRASGTGKIYLYGKPANAKMSGNGKKLVRR